MIKWVNPVGLTIQIPRMVIQTLVRKIIPIGITMTDQKMIKNNSLLIGLTSAHLQVMEVIEEMATGEKEGTPEETDAVVDLHVIPQVHHHHHQTEMKMNLLHQIMVVETDLLLET